MKNLENVSCEQLNLCLHEVKRLLKQLGKVMPDPEMPDQEVYQQSSHLVSQTDALQEALTVEIVRRQFLLLQAQLGAEESTTMKLEQLSTEQLNICFRETKWILKQLSWVTPHVHENEFYQLVENIDSRAIVIQDSLRVERARRALVHLQTQLATK